MPTGYKLAVVLIIVSGLATSGVLALVRLTNKPVPYGPYTDAEARHIVGYAVRRPTYLPPGINPRADTGGVVPKAKSFECEYDDDSTKTGYVELRAVTVTEAAHGKLDGVTKAGHRRDVRVQGHPAAIADVEDFPGHRVVAWTDKGVDYEIGAAGGNISDDELLKVANSMTAVSK